MKAAVRPLNGRHALVTGASSGIGEAVARRLAAAGAAVVVNYRSHPKEAKKIVAEIKSAGGQAIAVHADMSKEREIKTMFARMFREVGAIDILVNNAGIENKSPFLDMSLQDWDQVMAVNLRGAFLCSQLAARRMVKNGRGVIINISSVHQIIP